jgi:hypothetical protein
MAFIRLESKVGKQPDADVQLVVSSLRWWRANLPGPGPAAG